MLSCCIFYCNIYLFILFFCCFAPLALPHSVYVSHPPFDGTVSRVRFHIWNVKSQVTTENVKGAKVKANRERRNKKKLRRKRNVEVATFFSLVYWLGIKPSHIFAFSNRAPAATKQNHNTKRIDGAATTKKKRQNKCLCSYKCGRRTTKKNLHLYVYHTHICDITINSSLMSVSVCVFVFALLFGLSSTKTIKSIALSL